MILNVRAVAMVRVLAHATIITMAMEKAKTEF